MKKIITYLIISALFFIGSVSSTAIESRYKNNLLNVELSQTPDNRVSVLLVFEKPYTDPIKVVYKTDNEYNILLPETYHSITSVSAINALNVRSANVKLVPYFNQDNSNGYTKITIKTTRPVIFNAHSSYITTKIAKDDLIDKLERDESLKIQPTTLKPQPVKKAAATKKQPAKTTGKASAKKPAAARKAPAKTYSKTKTAYKKPVPKQAAKQPVKTTPKPTQKVQPKPVKPAVQTQPKPAQPVQSTPAVPQAEQKPLTPPTVQQPIVPEPPKPAIEPTPAPQEITTQQKIINLLNAVKTNENTPLAVLIVASILLLALLIKVFGAAKTYIKPAKRNIQINDVPQTTIPQEIKDLSWQEKYKYMKEQEEIQQAARAAEQEAQRQSELENIYAQTEPEQPSYTPPIQPAQPVQKAVAEPAAQDNIQTEEVKIQQNNISDIPEPFKLSDEPVNEGFEPAYQATEEPGEITDLESLAADLDSLNDISDIEPVVDEIYEQAPDSEHLEEQPAVVDVEINEPYSTKPIEPTLINQAKISKTKGFYLIRYEKEVALVGYIKDKIFFIHSFNNMNQSFVRTRLTEKQKGSDIYLVRSDDYKALIKVSKDEMKTLINL